MRWRLPSNANGLRDDGHRQDAELFRDLRDHGRRARAGAAAHPGRQEQHVGAGDQLRDAIAILHRGLPADFGIGARAETLGDVRPELQLNLRLIAFERLCIGVRDDELHALHALRDHVVDRVAAAAAHADHLDDCFLRM